ncbi:MFS transporter [Xylanimonas ulmi]|uniref:Putative MFS family arabinose efflux permease n=1 Tax=Xylanimonas ulmi TaxID=228973 RepID=A0A4Q7M7W4_9MICO|nr:MFS transporter [Xylanibacterium ulmi]RZS62778.1 putative MFS family arabinose efflux permease [Xylanibacterium ulmi]
MPRNPYVDVLRIPGAAAFSASGGLARLPMSMVGIGTVLMIQAYTGSYAVAGRVSAVLVIAQALGSPQVARFVDRAGQRRVLLPMLAVTTAGLLGLVTAAAAGAPEPVLWPLAMVAGATSGSYGSYVRARWTHALVGDPHRLHAAFSFESAVDELVFIVGPVLATVLATAVIPPAALLLAAVTGGVGGLVFLSLRGTEPPVRAHLEGAAHDDGAGLARSRVRPPGPRSALFVPGMPALALVFLAMGTIFGAVDVATVAFSTEHERRALAGVVLAAFALGSLVSGLAYGAMHWTSRLSTRFAIGTVVLAAGVSLFFTVRSLPVLALVMCVTGFAIAPTVINGNAMVQALVPPQRLTEGLAWVGTSIGAGASAGSWLAGARIDAAGSHGGFLVAMVAGWVCVVLAVAALPTLRRQQGRAGLAVEQVPDPGTPAGA